MLGKVLTGSLLLVVCAFGSAVVQQVSVELPTTELGTAVVSTLPEQVPQQRLNPDPFDLEKSAKDLESTVAKNLDVAPTENAPAEPQVGIPVQVWLSSGLMVMCFFAYVLLARWGR
jgi:hypothetical protein